MVSKFSGTTLFACAFSCIKRVDEKLKTVTVQVSRNGSIIADSAVAERVCVLDSFNLPIIKGGSLSF